MSPKNIEPTDLRSIARNGLNLIELAIVMAVVGIIIGAIYVAASAVYRNIKENEIQEDVVQIVQNVRSTYGIIKEIPTGSISNTTLVQAGIIPSDMIQSDGSIVDPFGGAVTIFGNYVYANSIALIINQVPESVCSDILVKETASGTAGAANSGLIAIGINGAITSPSTMSPASAESFCATTVNGVMNSSVLLIYKVF